MIRVRVRRKERSQISAEAVERISLEKMMMR
jgi:hypothetical protein